MKQLRRNTVLAGAFVSALTGMQLVACGSNTSSDGTGNGTNENGGSRNGAVGGDTSIGIVDPTTLNGSSSSTSVTAAPATEGANCGATTTELKKNPADLLMVLDRSSSMTRAMDSADDCAVNSTACAQRWATMVSSLTTVLDTSPVDVYWGLKFFTSPPTTGGGGNASRCYVSAGVEVAVAPNSSATIQTQINQAGTASSTPTRLAIEAAVTYLDTLNDNNPKYILLATDGEPNCAPGASNTSNSDLTATTTAVQNAAAAGYKVFVIGVGPEAANLTALAQAGGTDHFYSASTPAELSSALSTIVGTVAAGCTYPLGATPLADPNAIGVYLDKSLVPQSSTDGWTIDSANTTITINGSYCADLTSGKKTLVEIFLPCKAADPIPPILQ